MLSQIAESELSRQSLFRCLTADDLKIVQPFLHYRALCEHCTIFKRGQSGSGVFLLQQGTVKVCTVAEGDAGERERIIALCGPGELLGEMDALDRAGHSASVVTMEASHFFWISPDDFCRCLHFLPQLHGNLVQILARRLRRLTLKDIVRTRLDHQGKLAWQLLLFAYDYGVKSSEGVLLPLCLTQSELAALIGASRECVNRTLSYFRRHGYVALSESGYVVLRNLAVLQSYCAGCDVPLRPELMMDEK
jgi:CRP-like cAMP-binding protein